MIQNYPHFPLSMCRSRARNKINSDQSAPDPDLRAPLLAHHRAPCPPHSTAGDSYPAHSHGPGPPSVHMPPACHQSACSRLPTRKSTRVQTARRAVWTPKKYLIRFFSFLKLLLFFNLRCPATRSIYSTKLLFQGPNQNAQTSPQHAIYRHCHRPMSTRSSPLPSAQQPLYAAISSDFHHFWLCVTAGAVILDVR